MSDSTERNAWMEIAAQHLRNEEYYRGLVVQIGEMLGEQAYISDDGSRQQDVLCAKVPDLVRARLSPAPVGEVGEAGELVKDMRFGLETTEACLKTWNGGRGGPANVEGFIARADAFLASLKPETTK